MEFTIEDSELHPMMLEIARGYPDFNELTERWSDDDVLRYISNCAYGFINRERRMNPSMKFSMEIVRSKTAIGLSLAFHERVEMGELERLMGNHMNDNSYFHDTLKIGGYNHSLRVIDGEDLYLPAHFKASKEELNMIKRVARNLGYDVGESALIISKPNWMIPFADFHLKGYTREKILIKHRQLQFNINPPHDLPHLEEVERAVQFWENTGVTYKPVIKACLLDPGR